jgi:glycosyltransferase involved in cell wall biosynthesis
MQYSVLMSVYSKEKGSYLKESIDSILNQTILTNDFVIVCDGPLTEELDNVLLNYSVKYKFVNIIRLPNNLGLGKALNFGLDYCKNDIVARMDSDDISLPIRCETQLNVLFKDSELSMLSCPVIEFDDYSKNKLKIKKLPVLHHEIVKYSKKRNPFNHPAVMFRKSVILEVGGFKHFPLYEDYHLWIRIILSNKKTANTIEPLLYMRTGRDLYKRRGGFKYFMTGKKFQDYLLASKHIDIFRYCLNVGYRFFIQVLLPNNFREIYYKLILRKNLKNK